MNFETAQPGSGAHKVRSRFTLGMVGRCGSVQFGVIFCAQWARICPSCVKRMYGLVCGCFSLEDFHTVHCAVAMSGQSKLYHVPLSHSSSLKVSRFMHQQGRLLF